MNKSEMEKEEQRWRVEEDLHTLVRAAQIRRDSKRYKAAQALARKQMDSLKDNAKGSA